MRLGVFPGTFNPPTRAHLAIATAALSSVERVLFVLPRAFPHKAYEAAAFDQRMAMLRAALRDEPRFSADATGGGLFIEIARECRRIYSDATQLVFLCGRDAAERIVSWDYGRAGAIAEILEEFELAVAARQGEYQPPEELRHRIYSLPVPDDLGAISASGVRARIVRGESWEHMVPPSIAGLVREIYRPITPPAASAP